MSLYKELLVYKKSYNLVISLYKYTNELPESERYGLTSQIKRAAFSIPTNIAEGYGKEDTKQETNRYLRMSKGSCSELSVLIDICRDVGYMKMEHHEIYSKEIEEISKMLYGIIESLK